MGEAQAIMRMAARLANLQLGDIPHTSALIPVVIQALEGQILELLQEALNLSVNAQMDSWTECRIFGVGDVENRDERNIL
ncbi:unnamed protein product [Penicillium camemberti]|uniref:Str. FM013 n=1 Tax=Penicillium camemberti (strain FM 013) TaxID=1429867 RepID=A0A0G4P6P4_PENC3|nr:unnamed protein product [Penicillium camemberti]